MQRSRTGEWPADAPGPGLTDEHIRHPPYPVDPVTDGRTEMDRWQRHSIAVKVVRDVIVQEGYRLSSWQGELRVDKNVAQTGKIDHFASGSHASIKQEYSRPDAPPLRRCAVGGD